MKISYCTTCMGRAHHLKRTLPENIRNAVLEAESFSEVEFVVLNYSSPDDLHEWIMGDQDMKAFMDAGILTYARHDGEVEFLHSHAKNMAHRIADGDVLCNLDADNYIGEGFHSFLKDSFTRDIDSVVFPNIDNSNLSDEERGYFGRIALSRPNFYMLGGYDEDRRSGWGGEDTDFVVRSVEAMLKIAHCTNTDHLQTIAHSSAERFAFLGSEAAESSSCYQNTSQLSDLSVKKVFNQISFLVGHAQRNRDGHFGEGMLYYGQDQGALEIVPGEVYMTPCRRHIRGIANLVLSRFAPKGCF